MTCTAGEPTTDPNQLFHPDGLATKVVHYQTDRLVRGGIIQESDREDFQQELCIELLKRLHNYDPNRSKLSTFLSVSTFWAIKDVLQARCDGEHEAPPNTLSLDTPITTNRGVVSLADMMTASNQLRGLGCPERDECEQIELRSDLEDVLATLPPDLKTLCTELLESSDPKTVLQDADCEAVQALRDHFEAAGMHDYL